MKRFFLLALFAISLFPFQTAFARNHGERALNNEVVEDNARARQEREEAEQRASPVPLELSSETRARQAAQEAARRAAAPPAPAAPPITRIIPQLSVPIPGVTFTAPAVEGTSISVPFLAQYIGGIYTYALGISTIIAIIMVVYGGFLYLIEPVKEQMGIGSSKTTVTGKEIIKDAVMGLLVLYGAYFILWQINPNLVSLRPIRINSIDEMDLIEQGQMGTTADTSLTGNEGVNVTYAECPVPNLPVGHRDWPWPCGHPNQPVCTDHAMRDDPRAIAFATAMRPLANGATLQQRILQVSEAAAKCGVHFGDCGRTASKILSIAGSQRMVSVFANRDLVRLGNRTRCGDCKASARASGATQCDSCGEAITTQCVNDTAEAVRIVRAAMTSLPNQRDPGTVLLPGDWFKVYNGNKSCGAGHSMILLSWQGNSGRVLNGQSGKNAWIGPTGCLRNCGAGSGAIIYEIKRGQ